MTDELLSNGVAANLLNELLPNKTPEQWLLWLQNNRNKARPATYRIPVEKLGGGVFYLREEVVKFAEFEKSKTLGAIKLTGRAVEVLRAIGFNEHGGSSTGRSFNPSGVYLQTDESTGNEFLQLHTKDPLMIYRIEIDAAEFLLKELTEALTACRRHAQEQKARPDISEYVTITDDQDILIKRRVAK